MTMEEEIDICQALLPSTRGTDLQRNMFALTPAAKRGNAQGNHMKRRRKNQTATPQQARNQQVDQDVQDTEEGIPQGLLTKSARLLLQ